MSFSIAKSPAEVIKSNNFMKMSSGKIKDRIELTFNGKNYKVAVLTKEPSFLKSFLHFKMHIIVNEKLTTVWINKSSFKKRVVSEVTEFQNKKQSYERMLSLFRRNSSVSSIDSTMKKDRTPSISSDSTDEEPYKDKFGNPI